MTFVAGLQDIIKKMILKVATIGRLAQQVFSGVSEATVWGLTSRGVFLHLPSGWMVFLSEENCRGPLTLSIAGDLQPLLSLVPGTRIDVQNNHLSFKNLGLNVHFYEAVPWEPPALPGEVQPIDKRRQCLFSVIQHVLRHSTGNLLRALLITMKEMQAFPNVAKCNLSSCSHPEFARLIQVLNQDEPVAFGEALSPFVGRGGGLTPAGDDLLSGLLLALNRWGGVLYPKLELRIQSFSRAAIRLAHQKTTLLSANLIECSALGQADERLVTALDGIVTGKPEPATCANGLLAWGSSSGSDALAGITLALLAISS